MNKPAKCIIMRKILFFVFLVCCCFVSIAQDCDLRLTTARSYKKQGEYKQAVAWYRKVLNDCGDYDGKVKAELQECQRKSKPAYVPVEQPGLRLNDTQIIFEAEGGNDAHISVTCEDEWIVNVTRGKDWLNVGKNGNLLVVDCSPNTHREQRNGIVYIIAGGGTIVAKINVRQDEGDYSSDPTSFDIPGLINGVIVFEKGETTPIFDYNRVDLINIVENLKGNVYLGVQVESPWCENKYDTKLLERRFESVMWFFVSSGLDSERITHYIYKNNEDREESCDKAFLRVISMSNNNISPTISQGKNKTSIEKNESLLVKSFDEKDNADIKEHTGYLSSTNITFRDKSVVPIIEDTNDNIDKTIAILQGNPSFKLQIEVYTYDTGRDETYERSFVQKRSVRVMKMFIDKGVDPEQILMKTYTTSDFVSNNLPLERKNCAIFRILVD